MVLAVLFGNRPFRKKNLGFGWIFSLWGKQCGFFKWHFFSYFRSLCAGSTYLHKGEKEERDDINGVLGIPTDFRTPWSWLTSSLGCFLEKGEWPELCCWYVSNTKKIHMCIATVYVCSLVLHTYISAPPVHTQKTWLGQWFTIFLNVLRQGGDKKVEGVTKRASRVWKIGWLYMKENSSR